MPTPDAQWIFPLPTPCCELLRCYQWLAKHANGCHGYLQPEGFARLVELCAREPLLAFGLAELFYLHARYSLAVTTYQLIAMRCENFRKSIVCMYVVATHQCRYRGCYINERGQDAIALDLALALGAPAPVVTKDSQGVRGDMRPLIDNPHELRYLNIICARLGGSHAPYDQSSVPRCHALVRRAVQIGWRVT
jgi:hypothetical protein